MIKLSKKDKDAFKKIATAQVVNTLEPVDFAELKAQKEREVVDVKIDVEALKGFLTR